MSYIFGKLWHLAIIWAIRKAFQCILQGVRFLLANHTRLSPTSENDSYIFRSARTSCRTFDFSRPVPSTRPVRNNFSWVHRWAVTLPPGLRYPSNCIFYESWWCQLSNSDENTNTKTNTDTNTNTETNKGKTNDSYDVIYCLKGDDKRILNMICYRQGL